MFWLSAGRAAAWASITLNDAPAGGVLRVAPALGGRSVSTGFALSTTGWLDAQGDLPLSFVFSSVTQAGAGRQTQRLPLCGRSANSSLQARPSRTAS